jgi:phosphoribosyl 1,2-cyclic phosphodiesterase
VPRDIGSQRKQLGQTRSNAAFRSHATITHRAASQEEIFPPPFPRRIGRKEKAEIDGARTCLGPRAGVFHHVETMSMKFCILGSGSSGNCALLQTAGARVLVDAGFSARKTSQLLAAVGETLARIDAIFLTHEHGDHAGLVDGLARFPQIKLFANAATSRALQSRMEFQGNWQIFETGARFRFFDLEVESFSVPHDAQDPVGFSFAVGAGDLFSPRRRLVWLTDLGHAPAHVHERLREVEIVVVEANHCSELLKADTKRPWSVKQRIAGRHGHLSNQGTRALLDAVASPTWRHVFLTHLSRDCNSVEVVRRAFADAPFANHCPLSVVEPGASTPLHDFA